eukprot:366492-Chlamydomonas_euryale.AAC.4
MPTRTSRWRERTRLAPPLPTLATRFGNECGPIPVEGAARDGDEVLGSQVRARPDAGALELCAAWHCDLQPRVADGSARALTQCSRLSRAVVVWCDWHTAVGNGSTLSYA